MKKRILYFIVLTLALFFIGGVFVSITLTSQHNVTIPIENGDNLYKLWVPSDKKYLANLDHTLTTNLKKKIPNMLNVNNLNYGITEFLSMIDVSFTINHSTYKVGLLGLSSNYLDQFSWNITKTGIISFPNGSIGLYDTSNLHLNNLSISSTIPNTNTNNTKLVSILSNIHENLFIQQHQSSLINDRHLTLIFDIDRIFDMSNQVINQIHPDKSFSYNMLINSNSSFLLDNSLKNLKEMISEDESRLTSYFSIFFPIDIIHISSNVETKILQMEGELAGILFYIQVTSLPILLISTGVMLMFIHNFQINAKTRDLLSKRGISRKQQFSLLSLIDISFLLIVFSTASVMIHGLMLILNLLIRFMTNILIMYFIIFISLLIIRLISLYLNLVSQTGEISDQNLNHASFFHKTMNYIKINHQRITYFMTGLILLILFLKYFLLSKNVIISTNLHVLLKRTLGLLTILIFIIIAYYSFSQDKVEIKKNKISKRYILDKLYNNNGVFYKGIKFLLLLSLFTLLLLPSTVILEQIYALNINNGQYLDDSNLKSASIKFRNPIKYNQLINLSNDEGIIDISPFFRGEVKISKTHFSNNLSPKFSSINLYDKYGLQFDSKNSYAENSPGQIYDNVRNSSKNIVISYDFARKSGLRINNTINLELFIRDLKYSSKEGNGIDLNNMKVVGYIKEYVNPGGVSFSDIYISNNIIIDSLYQKMIEIELSTYEILYDSNIISYKKVYDKLIVYLGLNSNDVIIDRGSSYNPFLNEENLRDIYLIQFIFFILFFMCLVYVLLQIIFTNLKNDTITYLTRGSKPSEVKKSIFRKYIYDMTYIFFIALMLSSVTLLTIWTSRYDLFIVTNKGSINYLLSVLSLTTLLYVIIAFSGYLLINSKISSYCNELYLTGDYYEFH